MELSKIEIGELTFGVFIQKPDENGEGEAIQLAAPGLSTFPMRNMVAVSLDTKQVYINGLSEHQKLEAMKTLDAILGTNLFNTLSAVEQSVDIWMNKFEAVSEKLGEVSETISLILGN